VDPLRLIHPTTVMRLSSMMTLDFDKNLGAGMKRTSRMVFLRLFICFTLFMTACQASSPTKKAGAHKDYDSENQFSRDYPTLDITSNTAKGQKNGAIFEGSVELKRGQLIKFFADYISIELSENNGGYYIIQMKGNVSMVTGGLIIKS
jgi:hypothetical protein